MCLTKTRTINATKNSTNKYKFNPKHKIYGEEDLLCIFKELPLYLDLTHKDHKFCWLKKKQTKERKKTHVIL